MITDDLRLDLRRTDLEMLRQMHAKAQTIKERTRAEHALVFGKGATDVARDVGTAMEGLDRRLCQWPVAGVLFLVLTAVLVGTMLVGH